MVFLAYPKDLQAQPLGGFLHCCLAPAPAQAGMRRAGMTGMRPLAWTCRQAGTTDARVFPREMPRIQRVSEEPTVGQTRECSASSLAGANTLPASCSGKGSAGKFLRNEL